MDTPTVEQAEAILDIMYEYELTEGEAEVREDYSGRGMYGATTVAIVTDDGARNVAIAIGIGVATGVLPDEAFRWFTRQDNMGLGSVIY
jgi:hypothetical protein